MEKLENQQCPFCNKKTLTLTEDKKEIPYFGNVFIFSMTCSNCKYHKADVEAEEQKEPCKYTIEVNSEKDMSIRVVKSSQATIKIPQMRISVTPGPASVGYISNIEGILNRFKKIIESEKDNAEDTKTRKHAKNLLKKIWKVKYGNEKLKIIIEDPSGNSAIISEKAEVKKLK
jgi:zinc finger protein